MFALLVVAGILAQEPSARLVPRCPGKACVGTHLRSAAFEMCVPRGVKVKESFDFEGDAHYELTVKWHGEKYSLDIESGGTFGPLRSKPPDWTRSAWSSVTSDTDLLKDLPDFRNRRNDRHSRFMIVPLGSADYEDVPAPVATTFDALLDSMCVRSAAFAKRTVH